MMHYSWRWNYEKQTVTPWAQYTVLNDTAWNRGCVHWGISEYRHYRSDLVCTSACMTVCSQTSERTKSLDDPSNVGLFPSELMTTLRNKREDNFEMELFWLVYFKARNERPGTGMETIASHHL